MARWAVRSGVFPGGFHLRLRTTWIHPGSTFPDLWIVFCKPRTLNAEPITFCKKPPRELPAHQLQRSRMLNWGREDTFYSQRKNLLTTIVCFLFHFSSYYNLDLSVCLSVSYLLRRLWTDWTQTWQDGRPAVGDLIWTGLKRCHDYHHTKRWQSVCTRESQGGNPIGKALVINNLECGDLTRPKTLPVLPPIKALQNSWILYWSLRLLHTSHRQFSLGRGNLYCLQELYGSHRTGKVLPSFRTKWH